MRQLLRLVLFSSAVSIDPPAVQRIVRRWPAADRHKVTAMMDTMMWEALNYSAIPLHNETWFFVNAGDFPYMWIRDSTASLHHLITTDAIDQPYPRRAVEGLTRSLAHYIGINPNCSVWKPPTGETGDKQCWDHRTELDSPMYFTRMVRLLREHGSTVAAEPAVENALRMIIDHVERWMDPSGFVATYARPSDDAVKSGYFHVPDNLFVAAELGRIQLSSASLENRRYLAKSKQLALRVKTAIQAYSVTRDGSSIYCYEVRVKDWDCLKMDDANVPSLLSFPYLDQSASAYDVAIYNRTRAWVLSVKNPYYFVSDDGAVAGVGSPHRTQNADGAWMPKASVWPMALAMQALTARSNEEAAAVLQMLIHTDAGTNLMHEEFDVNDPANFSRAWFDWPNALFVELAHRAGFIVNVTKPPLAFDGWVTCAFRYGVCDVANSMAKSSPGHSQGRLPKVVCIRYGTTFRGFVYRTVQVSELVKCTNEGIGAEPPFIRTFTYFPYHCAIAWVEQCPTSDLVVV